MPRLERLIIATAGDDISLGAIHVGAKLARRCGASVTAIGVTSPFPRHVGSVLAPSPTAADEENRQELLGVVRETVATIPGTESWSKRAVVGNPALAIAAVAGEAPGTLILMGLGHHGRLDRLFGGETTIPLMRHARMPVLAVDSSAHSLPKHAVAAIDFSEASIASATLAAELLDDDGTLTLAHVAAFADAKARPGDLVDLYRAGVRARLAEAVGTLQRRTHRVVESVTLHGQIADALLKYAEQEGGDLIALGGQERGLVDRILLGSVRTSVLRGATCSVLITPPKTERPES